MDRRVTPPKRVTSPIWCTPPPCKQALSRLQNRQCTCVRKKGAASWRCFGLKKVTQWPSTLDPKQTQIPFFINYLKCFNTSNIAVKQ